MSYYKGIIKITLMSDLCVGSGFSYAGIVDSDICYNQNGLPYIPARRLKGCLKEAAEIIRVKDIESIFGTSGNNAIKGVLVENAYIENHTELNKEIGFLKASEEKHTDLLNAQNILEYFTSILAQTKVDDKTGIAEENSLRYTRVVNQYAPHISGNIPLIFYAPIEFDCEKEEIVRIVKALRHIGLKRNRGLGNVKCELIDCNEILLESSSLESENENLDELCQLTYVIENTQPLMISGEYDKKTENHILGQSVLGAVASMYLRTYGQEPDCTFNDVFLKGEVQFSNLYFAKKKKDHEFGRYEPAPLFINRLKKSKKLINLAAIEGGKENEPAEYNKGNGNQPKQLKTQYLYFESPNTIDVKEVEIDMVYHHSKVSKSKNGVDGILYTLEAIKEGQYFAGTICGTRKHINLVKTLLEENTLRLGKSRTAQYGTCEIVDMKIEKIESKSQKFNAGDKISVAFSSNAIFSGDLGYTVDYTEVKAKVAKSLGIIYGEEENFSSLNAGVVGGYNAMWNLQKQSIPVIKAGSVLEYTLEKECIIDQSIKYVGEKNLEGFGEIHIFNTGDFQYKVDDMEAISNKIEPEYTVDLLNNISLKNTFLDMKYNVLDQIKKYSIGTSSLLGRVTLMLSESINENRGDSEQIFKAFIERVNSIKDADKKKKVIKYLSNYIANDQSGKLIISVHNIPDDCNKYVRTEINNLWWDYLMHILVYQKYLQKEI